MIESTDLPAAPAPDETVTTIAGSRRSTQGLRSEVDMLDALEQGAARRRAVGDGGAWVALSPSAQGEAAAGGRPAGPLERTILAVKDLVAVAGLPVGAGSRVRSGAPDEPADAGVVRALRAAGAVVAGTVALHEMAFGVSGVNDELGFPPNPNDPQRVPGGSSSGSAVAVADRTADLAVGTDTGGSVRIPAAFCGVVGFKPATPYPLDGVLPLAPTLDQVGFLARSVADVALAHRAVTGEAGQAPQAPASRQSTAPRIGVERAALEVADGEVAAAIESALDRMQAAGWQLVDVEWPDRVEVLDVSTTIMFAEAAAVHRHLLDGPAGGLLGAPVRSRFDTGAAIGEDDYRAALAAADRITADVRKALATVDAVVGPTVPIVAPTIDSARRDEALPRRIVAETRLANVAHTPALTVPVPSAGLPVGLQVTADTDAATLAIGQEIAALIAR